MIVTTRILLVSGSTRNGSSNTAALLTAHELAPEGVTVDLYSGMAELPAFNPDNDRDPLDPLVADLRQQIAAADAVVFCTPEYAGALPGSFKNLLDWIVGGGELSDKPAAWFNVAAEGRGDKAHAALLTVLSYLGVVLVDSACVRLPLSRDWIGPDGAVTDAEFRGRVGEAVRALREHAGAASGD